MCSREPLSARRRGAQKLDWTFRKVSPDVDKCVEHLKKIFMPGGAVGDLPPWGKPGDPTGEGASAVRAKAQEKDDKELEKQQEAEADQDKDSEKDSDKGKDKDQESE